MNSGLESKHFKLITWIRIQKLPFEFLRRLWVMKRFLPITAQNIDTQITDVTKLLGRKSHQLDPRHQSERMNGWKGCITLQHHYQGISRSLQKQPEETKLMRTGDCAEVTSCYRSGGPTTETFYIYDVPTKNSIMHSDNLSSAESMLQSAQPQNTKLKTKASYTHLL